jgi:uncharacterized protein (TIGR00369 family)
VNSTPSDELRAGLERICGLELVEVSEDHARGKVAVREELKQPLGFVHGGVYAVIAESLVSVATAEAVAPQRRIEAPLSTQTSFLRPIGEGTIHALATAKHMGRTTWVWEVEMTDDQGRLCVLARMTIALSEG